MKSGQKREGKKKVDYAALASPFMRIPRMDVAAARALLDLNIKEIFQLRGRDPESIFEDLKKIRINPDASLLKSFKLAVDFAESADNM
ncbi:MAG: hypothetical protein DBX55_03025 [Verrucomicrobia bacterium]|nr:MAG: hypothetical protein DBX55_03025 [Verrucomicrobiota bacterium]